MQEVDVYDFPVAFAAERRICIVSSSFVTAALRIEECADFHPG
jgi:hypothetical protein